MMTEQELNKSNRSHYSKKCNKWKTRQLPLPSNNVKSSLTALLKDIPMGQRRVTLSGSVSSLAHSSPWYLILTSDWSNKKHAFFKAYIDLKADSYP